MIPRRPMLWTPFLLLIGTVVDAATLTHEFLENSDLLEGCRFSLGRQIYDLCPLMLERATREVHGTAWVLDEGLSLLSRRLYTFAFGGEPDDRQCPEGTWICMSETRGSDDAQHADSERTIHTPIVGKARHKSPLMDDGVNAVASIFDDDSDPSSPLNLFLIGGIQDGKPRYARIEFRCDLNSESTDPSFTGETLGVHSFSWSTKYGCPIPDARFNPALHTLDEDTNTNDPPPNSEDSGDEGENKLLDPKVPPRVSRRWVASILLVTGTLLITVTLLLASSRARFFFVSRLKAIVTTLRLPAALSLVPKPFRFRAGENRLVRWAQEDMSLGVLDEESREDGGDVDVMVNGEVRDRDEDGDWDWGAGTDEYIPLKSSPRRNKRDYGSARGGARFW